MYANLLIAAGVGFFVGGIIGSKIDERRRDESGAASKKALILGPIVAVVAVVLLNGY